jgi:hypothetical protein
LVPVRELDSSPLKGLFDHGQRCSASVSFSGLKQAHGRNANSSGVRELLLTPIKKSASRSALSRSQHL